MSSDAHTLLLHLMLDIGLLALAWPLVSRVLRWVHPAMPVARRGLLALLVVGSAAIGGDKSPIARHLASFVTALRSGTLIDPSGRIGAAASVAAAQEVARLSADIIGAASNTVASSQGTFDALADTLTNRNITVAYLAADLPRALPGTHTNSNIAANIQRTRQDGTNLLAWVWFSETPAIAPQIGLAYSVAPDTWAYLASVTNGYPATVDIDGVPCVEYTFAIPEPVCGIAFRPEYEMAFGGIGESDYLIVPLGGLIVDCGEAPCYGFTGTDVYSPSLSVTYKGGVAVSATFHGTNYTGVVTL